MGNTTVSLKITENIIIKVLLAILDFRVLEMGTLYGGPDIRIYQSYCKLWTQIIMC